MKACQTRRLTVGFTLVGGGLGCGLLYVHSCHMMSCTQLSHVTVVIEAAVTVHLRVVVVCVLHRKSLQRDVVQCFDLRCGASHVQAHVTSGEHGKIYILCLYLCFIASLDRL